jgi:hypothetical protein
MLGYSPSRGCGLWETDSIVLTAHHGRRPTRRRRGGYQTKHTQRFEMLYRAVAVIKFRSCGLSCGTKLAAAESDPGQLSLVTSAARANGTVSVGIELAQLSSYAL